jgi:PAS domain S-box-containing protein
LKRFLQIIVPGFLSVVLFGVTIFLYVLPHMEDAVMAKKREMSKELVRTVIELLASYEKQVIEGVLERDEAQKRAMDRVRALRYGPELKDYFWINDLEPKMIMHPYRRDLTNKSLRDFEDIHGKKVFIEATQKARQPEGGYVEYDWQWKDNPQKIVPKISYVALYQPWGWVIGSGIYYDDVKREISGLTRNLASAGLGVLFVVTLLSAYLSLRHIAAARERKTAMKALLLSEEKFRGISSSAHDGIVMMDSQGTVSFWNDAATKIFGYCPEEVIGRDLHALLALPEHFGRFNGAKEQFLKEGTGNAVGKTLELTAVRKDKEKIPVELSVSALLMEGKWHAVGVIRDISERIRAEKEKSLLEHQLQQARKMEAIGTLAGGIAHDFNNILFIMMGNTELAQLRYAGGEDILGALDEVRAAGVRARDLVQQILDFSRQTVKAKQPVVMATVITETMKLLRPAIPSRVEIHMDFNPDEGIVLADPTHIYQIIMNLCGNAAHSMEKNGGELRISLKEMDVSLISAPPHHDLKPGRYVELVVMDTGHGMTPEVMDRIFEPYFTTKQIGQGTGIGLSLVHSIVKDIGGKIHVESTPGKGSRFTLLFPVYAEGLAPNPTEETDAILPGRGHILVADDEFGITAACHGMLTKIGYRVTPVNEAPQAFELFKSAPNEFDLVITDLTMPTMTGIELTRRIKSIRPDIPVVLWTGFSNRLENANFKAYGFDYLLMKPPILKDLADVLGRALKNKKQELSSAVTGP